jgi:plastocyanin
VSRGAVARTAAALLAAGLVGLAGSGCGDSNDPVVLDLSATPADAAPEPDDAGAPTDDGGAALVTVSVGAGGGNLFSPRTVFIPAGGSVTWVWISGVHGVVSDDDPPAFERSPTQAGGRHTATFETAGQYGYHCSVHGRMMTGVVVVE